MLKNVKKVFLISFIFKTVLKNKYIPKTSQKLHKSIKKVFFVDFVFKTLLKNKYIPKTLQKNLKKSEKILKKTLLIIIQIIYFLFFMPILYKFYLINFPIKRLNISFFRVI